jgi:hypothetical protein
LVALLEADATSATTAVLTLAACLGQPHAAARSQSARFEELGQLRAVRAMAERVRDQFLARDVPMIETFRGVVPFLISDMVRLTLVVAFQS